MRSVSGKGQFEWTLDEVKSFAKEIHSHGLQVAAISAPLFKCDIHDDQTINQHIEGFRRCAEFCGILDCSIIRGFDFWKCGASISERAKKYRPILALCKAYCVTCAMEYDPSVHASTPSELREIIDAIGSPYVRAVFDPGNGVFSRPEVKPIPDDYVMMKPVLCHIHIKDAALVGEHVNAVCVGTGWVDYPTLLNQIIEDQYQGHLVLETHYRLNVQLTDEQLCLPGGNSFSNGAYAASAESIKALKQLIADAVNSQALIS